MECLRRGCGSRLPCAVSVGSYLVFFKYAPRAEGNTTGSQRMQALWCLLLQPPAAPGRCLLFQPLRLLHLALSAPHCRKTCFEYDQPWEALVPSPGGLQGWGPRLRMRGACWPHLQCDLSRSASLGTQRYLYGITCGRGPLRRSCCASLGLPWAGRSGSMQVRGRGGQAGR